MLDTIRIHHVLKVTLTRDRTLNFQVFLGGPINFAFNLLSCRNISIKTSSPELYLLQQLQIFVINKREEKTELFSGEIAQETRRLATKLCEKENWSNRIAMWIYFVLSVGFGR